MNLLFYTKIANFEKKEHVEDLKILTKKYKYISSFIVFEYNKMHNAWKYHF